MCGLAGQASRDNSCYMHKFDPELLHSHPLFTAVVRSGNHQAWILPLIYRLSKPEFIFEYTAGLGMDLISIRDKTKSLMMI